MKIFKFGRLFLFILAISIFFPYRSTFASSSITQNAATLSQIRSIIYTSLQNRDGECNILYTGAYGSLDDDSVNSIINSILDNDDYLKCSLLNYSYPSLVYDGNQKIYLTFNFVDTKDEEASVSDKVNEILSKIITNDMNDFNKEKVIHDYIVSNVAYDNTLSYQSAYDALTKQTATCRGYALLAYKMFTAAGMKNKIVFGEAGGEDHTWNLVYANNNWYHVDTTWDDPLPDMGYAVSSYKYFNLMDSEIKSDHSWDYSKYPSAITAFSKSIFSDTTVFPPEIISADISNGGYIDVKTENVVNGAQFQLKLTDEYGNDIYGSNGLNIFEDTQLKIYNNHAYISYDIDNSVSPGTYRIKVQLNNSTYLLTKQFTVNHNSVLIIKNLSSNLSGTVWDPDGVSNLTISMRDINGNYINLNTGEVSFYEDYSAVQFTNINTGEWTCDVPAADKVAPGTYTFSAYVTDSNGSETRVTFDYVKHAYDWKAILESKPWQSKYSGYEELPLMTDVPLNKQFVINFSLLLDINTVDNSDIQLVDAENDAVIPLTFKSINAFSIWAIPKQNMTNGRLYYIVIQPKIKSVMGNVLKQGIICPVKVKDF